MLILNYKKFETVEKLLKLNTTDPSSVSGLTSSTRGSRMLASTSLEEFNPVNIKYIFKFLFLVCVKGKSCKKQWQLTWGFSVGTFGLTFNGEKGSVDLWHAMKPPSFLLTWRTTLFTVGFMARVECSFLSWLDSKAEGRGGILVQLVSLDWLWNRGASGHT